jgi:hypothetical protein
VRHDLAAVRRDRDEILDPAATEAREVEAGSTVTTLSTASTKVDSGRSDGAS